MKHEEKNIPLVASLSLLVHWLVPSLLRTNWGRIVFVLVVLDRFLHACSFLPSSLGFFHILLYSTEIKLTLMRLYDYFRVLKLHQDVAHLRHQFYYIPNFILFLKRKVMNVSFLSILSRKFLLFSPKRRKE